MDTIHPDEAKKKAVRKGVAAATLFGIGMVALSAVTFMECGLVLFLCTPFLVGAVAPLVAGFSARITTAESIRAGMLSLMLVGIGLVLVALEGALCILMAAPLAAAIGFLGSVIGDYIQQRRWKNRAPLLFTVILLLPPSLLTAEREMGHDHAVRPVTTTVEIDAPPPVVWNRVLSFPELPPPDELLFRGGIAYPVRACIEGSGPGAVRYCDFSTGSFVEPITVWEQNRRLAFSVREQPVPLREFSPYGDIEPAHLHGYFVSTKGEFRLIDLGNGRTRLEGTTWYYQKLRPGFYWNLWSDRIIHTIHGRVLKHIKAEAEKGEERLRGPDNDSIQ